MSSVLSSTKPKKSLSFPLAQTLSLYINLFLALDFFSLWSLDDQPASLNFRTHNMEEDRRVNREENVETHFIHQQKQHPANLFESFWLEKPPKHTNPEAPEEPDLNLRLSLGSIDSENTLARSSSIAGVMNLRKASSEAEMSILPLERSCSLPTEAEQVHRTFYLMELQRMMKEEAQKQPVEGQNNAKEAKGKKKSLANLKVAAWQTASLSKPTAQTPPIVRVKETGPKGSGAANAASSFKSSSQPKNLGPLVSSGANSNSNLVEPEETTPENAFKRPRISYGNVQDNGMDVMRQMPSVSTIGDGPNGRKVEGFLYRYVKGHVSIVCVCHGCFLSPAEFVKHAGGRDVPNPMQHITVSTSFSV